MSIENWGITYVVQCDFCSETFDTDVYKEDGFMAAVDAVKREGWKTLKVKGDWQHKCHCCQEGDLDNDFVTV